MIGGFGILTFEVSEDNIKSIEGQLSRTLTAKISEHNAINGIGMIRHQGRELQEISFKMNLISQDKVNPVNELAKIQDMLEVGAYNHLILNGTVVGDFPFIILSASQTMSYFHKEQGIQAIEVDISMKEYIEDPTMYDKLIEAKKEKTSLTTEEVLASVDIEQTSIEDQVVNMLGGDSTV